MKLTIEQALQRAIQEHKAGKLQDAENLYRAILQIQPKHPDANHNLGVLAVSLNKTEAALPLFKIALEANTNQGQFWLSYVDALVKEKQFNLARSVLDQGKKRGLVGEKIDVLEAQLAANFLTQNLEFSSKNNPLTTFQKFKKVSTEKERKRNSLSNQTNLNQARSPSQVDVNSLLEHYQTGRYDLAESLAKGLTQKYPDHQLSWKVLGSVFKQTGRLKDSLIANQKADEISPNDAEVHYNLGNTLKELGRLKDAEASYKKATAINPEFAQAHSNLGNTLKALNRLEDAVTSYKKAIAIKPHYAEANYNLGNTLQELGRLEDALTSYKKAIAIKPDYAEAHNNLGNTLKALERLEDAETNYKKAIAIKPDYAEAHSNLGNTLKALNRLEDAETSYKKAIAINPEYAEAFFNLGILLLEAGRHDQATKTLKLINFKNSQSYLLRSLYYQNERVQFNELLNALILQGEVNPIIGSITSRAQAKYGFINRNLFCEEPFKYVLKKNLNTSYDFPNTFIVPIKTILSQNERRNRLQKLLFNGRQTAGNIFDLGLDLTAEIEKLIRIEIEKYRAYFKDSQEGFMKKWPTHYNLFGWLISMKSGGKLRPHMHENGWISGSVYINVPPKSNLDSGNLVVCIDDQNYLLDGKASNEQIIAVTTGSLCLFPASLLHYTIPFESEEDRIVLAFDVVPKSS
jgi:tetratricopeptide (TPR) repeat protein